MAKEYGTPIAPTRSVEKVIEDLADHLNWSKSDVVGYCVINQKDDLLSHPRALRFSEDI